VQVGGVGGAGGAGGAGRKEVLIESGSMWDRNGWIDG